MPLFLGVAERRGLSLLVSLYALVIDYAAPVQSERKVVDISVGVAVAADVARAVLAMLLHSLHLFRQLHWQQSRRLAASGNQVHISLRLHVEANKDCVGKRLNLAHHGRV